MTLLDAVCQAAGWQAYCEICSAEMRRVVQLGGAMSLCSNNECPSKEYKPIENYIGYDDEPQEDGE